MTVRSDILFEWHVDPRHIHIEAPSVVVTIQDLVDTIRTKEADFSGMDHPFVIDAFGKEEIGSGVLVGITLVLQNAQIHFADRAGPSTIRCRVEGGNIAAVDANGAEINPLQPSTFTQVQISQSSSATIIQGAVEDFWDALTDDHITDGSFGNKIKRIKSNRV